MKALALLGVCAFVSAAKPAAIDYAGLWATWKSENKRTYSASEDQARFRYFVANAKQIQELNAGHIARKSTGRFSLNKFADKSPAELKGMRGTRVPAGARDNMPVAASLAAVQDNSTVDWTKTGYVSPIQDQGQCGSCWAFSATANMESRFAIKHKISPPKKLAEQALVDCDHHCGTYRGEQGCDAGCNGGLMPNAFQYVMASGQPGEAAYPYYGIDQTCGTKGMPSMVNISSFELVSTDETQIASYLAANGPVSIAVNAAQWSFYEGGVMEWLCWGKQTLADLDHGVVLVGYGMDGSTPYWLVRNSWGTDWGESGYARILRNDGFCGVNLFACSSISG